MEGIVGLKIYFQIKTCMCQCCGCVSPYREPKADEHDGDFLGCLELVECDFSLCDVSFICLPSG